MSRPRIILVAIATTVLFATVAAAQTIVPLNTGYDHGLYNPYPTVSTPISSTQDQYWINIATYPTTTPAVGSTYVLQQPSYWTTALPSSHWISARNDALSLSNVNANNPGYTIYRKCFCLLPNYNSPQISFRARSDDTLQVWFNSHLFTLLPAQFGSFNGTALSSLPSDPRWFHVGLNCLYALVEDTYGGATGFNLEGTIQATGLAPQAALGSDATFDCPCRDSVPGTGTLDSPRGDADVVAALIDIAEERRLARTSIVRRRP